MTDIVERLRNWEKVDIVDAHEDGALYNAAADEIQRLRGLIKEALALARQNHYGNMYLEIQSLADGIGFLEDNLEEPGK